MENAEGGLLLKVPLKKTNNLPLEKLFFTATLPYSSKERLLRFAGAGESGMSMSVRKSISSDGHEAKLDYTLPSGESPILKVLVSGPAQVTIISNYFLKPIIIAVK